MKRVEEEEIVRDGCRLTRVAELQVDVTLPDGRVSRVLGRLTKESAPEILRAARQGVPS